MATLIERLQDCIDRIREDYEPLIIPKHNKGAGYRKNPAWDYGDPNKQETGEFPPRTLIKVIQDNKNTPLMKKILSKDNVWAENIKDVLRNKNRGFLKSKFLQYCMIRAFDLDKYNIIDSRNFRSESISFYDARNEIVEIAENIISLYNSHRDDHDNYLDSLKENPKLANNKQVKNLLKRGVNPRDILITYDELDDAFWEDDEAIVNAIAFASLCNIPDLVKELKSNRTIIKAMKIMEYLVYEG